MSKQLSEYQQLETTDQIRVSTEEKTEQLQPGHPAHLLAHIPTSSSMHPFWTADRVTETWKRLKEG